MSLTPGTRLGVYEVTAPIGEGGMGQVFRARDTKLDRDVAIKILPDAFAHDADRLARFTREAKTLASLNHSNIAGIYGLEESGGMTALVMELVEGDDLSQRIARGAIPIDETLPIAKQIAEALEAAHEQGIIHRDLKPANIKVRADGTVKVLDFGLAKAMDPAAGSTPNVSMSPTITTPAMTQAGMILGTAAYMAPEQAKGRPADKRCDVWAFGCVLYEMLTGTRVFAGEDVSDTLAFILTREPNWAALPANTPPGIRRLLRRCLERDRKRRIADISTAAFIIDEGEIAEPGSAMPALHDRRPLWQRAVPVVGVSLLAAAAVGVAWNLRQPQAPAALVRFSFPVPEGQVLTANGARAVAISPDGTNVVYAADRQLYVRNIAELEARAIQGTQGAEEPFFSPDGKWLAFYASNDRKIKKIAITGGTPVALCDADTLLGASWAPEDSIFFGQGQKGILRVSANGGTPDVVAKGTSGEFAQGPRMLPGGDALLFTLAQSRTNTSWDRGQIVVESLKSGERKVLVGGGSDAAYVPTGHIVYAVGPTLLAVAFDTKALEITGGPVPAIEDVRRAPTGTTGAAQYSISSTGSIAYLPGGGDDSEVTLALVDHAGGRTPLNIEPGVYSHPRLSPNGELLAVQKDNGREQNVWLYGLKGAAPIRRLTFGGAINNRPTWTPDGQRIVFRSDREGDGGLFWQRADGTGAAERLALAEEATTLQPEAWSPDGKTLVVSVSRGGDRSLSMLPLGADQRPKPLVAAWSSNASLSPDGQWLAYMSNESGYEVYVQPFPPTGAKYLVAARGSTNPLWSPDGRQLFYLQTQNAGSQIVSVSVQVQPGFVVTGVTPLPIQGIYQLGARSYDITPDGKQFVVMFQKSRANVDKPPDVQINVTLNWFTELQQRVPTR